MGRPQPSCGPCKRELSAASSRGTASPPPPLIGSSLHSGPAPNSSSCRAGPGEKPEKARRGGRSSSNLPVRTRVRCASLNTFPWANAPQQQCRWGGGPRVPGQQVAIWRLGGPMACAGGLGVLSCMIREAWPSPAPFWTNTGCRALLQGEEPRAGGPSTSPNVPRHGSHSAPCNGTGLTEAAVLGPLTCGGDRM